MDAPARIDPAGQAVVRATDERPAVFNRAEDGVCGMLPLRGAFAEPAVVGQVQKEIRVVVHVAAG